MEEVTETRLSCLECRTITCAPHPLYPQLCTPCGSWMEHMAGLNESAERVASFSEIAGRAMTGETPRTERRWMIK